MNILMADDCGVLSRIDSGSIRVYGCPFSRLRVYENNDCRGSQPIRFWAPTYMYLGDGYM
jgi:hypothetical protein